MTYRFSALIAALGALTLALSADAVTARPGVAVGAAPRAVAASHPNFRPHAGGLGHHLGRSFGTGAFWWPPYYDDFSGSYGSAPLAEVPPPSNDITYTYKYDVPWDWAHRFPPNVTPSDRQYVPSCTDQAVTVPGDGGDRTVTITRCY